MNDIVVRYYKGKSSNNIYSLCLFTDVKILIGSTTQGQAEFLEKKIVEILTPALAKFNATPIVQCSVESDTEIWCNVATKRDSETIHVSAPLLIAEFDEERGGELFDKIHPIIPVKTLVS